MGRKRKMSQVDLFVIHHSASNDATTDIADLMAHRRKTNEGYNGIIDDDDALAHKAKGDDGHAEYRQDAPDDEVSNGTYGANLRSLNICVDGNFELAPPTPDEVSMLVQVLATKMKRLGFKKADVWRIVGHREVGQRFATVRYATACPGRYLIALIPEIRRRVAAYLPA